MIRWLGALVVCSGIGLAGGGDAEPITVDGLTFSDELGGVRLEQGWGSGSLDDPIVLVEEITGDGPAILIVRGMTHRFGNRIRSHHEVGFALTKLVRNGTGQPWTLFNVELREFFDLRQPVRRRPVVRPGERRRPAVRVPTASPRPSRPASRSTAWSSSMAWSSRARPWR